MKSGERIGRCAIDSAIAGGAMGRMYRATQTRLGWAVAMKVLLPN